MSSRAPLFPKVSNKLYCLVSDAFRRAPQKGYATTERTLLLRSQLLLGPIGSIVTLRQRPSGRSVIDGAGKTRSCSLAGTPCGQILMFLSMSISLERHQSAYSFINGRVTETLGGPWYLRISFMLVRVEPTDHFSRYALFTAAHPRFLIAWIGVTVLKPHNANTTGACHSVLPHLDNRNLPALRVNMPSQNSKRFFFAGSASRAGVGLFRCLVSDIVK